ncbi:hypothetical protein GOBAR_DD36525 [Gossypium barbadense]|nr:hypothetical protein GOBAR_DD36525 [Gossypium barbadense]
MICERERLVRSGILNRRSGYCFLCASKQEESRGGWPYCTGWAMAQYAGPSYHGPRASQRPSPSAGRTGCFAGVHGGLFPAYDSYPTSDKSYETNSAGDRHSDSLLGADEDELLRAPEDSFYSILGAFLGFRGHGPPALHFLIDLEPSFFVLDLGFELMEIRDSRLFGQVLHVGKKLDRVDDFLQFFIIVHSRRPSYFFSFLKYLIVVITVENKHAMPGDWNPLRSAEQTDNRDFQFCLS